MATTGGTSQTYAFAPTYADITLEMFDRCQIRPAALTREHMSSARLSLNFLLVSWANRGINLWEIQFGPPIQLIQGVSTYPVPVNAVGLLDVYITTQTAGADPIDRILYGIGRSEYAAYPDKAQQGFPTVYWYDRQTKPQITLWQAPDQNGPYTLNFYSMRQVQDAGLGMGQQPDVPYRFLDALVAGGAARVARKYAPALVDSLKIEAKEAWMEAAEEDRERVPVYVRPALDGYYR